MKKGLVILLLFSAVVFAQSNDSFQQSIDGLRLEVAGLRQDVDRVMALPSREFPAPVFPVYLTVLLGLNAFLLIVVIVLIVWLRERRIVRKSAEPKSKHIHPCPREVSDFVRSGLDKGMSLDDIRLELADKGWSPAVIEHAVLVAREH